MEAYLSFLPMRTEKLFELLDAIHPLTPEFKKALRKELEPVSYPEGHFLINANSRPQTIWFLCSGFAVSYYFDNMKRSVTAFSQPDTLIISPQSFLRDSKAEEATQLTRDSELLALGCHAANKLLQDFPVANYYATALLVQTTVRLQRRIVDMHSLAAWQRYIKLKQEYPELEQHVSQELIASYLTITPQSLSRLKHTNLGRS